MGKYYSYKDSNVSWIGEVPTEWPSLRLRYYLTLEKGSKPVDISSIPNGNLPYLTMDYLRGRDNKSVQFPVNTDNLTCVNEGDILVLWDGANAGEIVRAKSGYLSSTMAVIRFDKSVFDGNFLFFFLKALEPVLKDYSSGTTIPHFDSSIILDEHYCIPSLGEQIVIAKHLNDVFEKTGLVIREKEQIAIELQELKNSIINESICGQFIEGCSFADSGDEFIGVIPSHWSIQKTLRCLSMPITDGPHTTPDLFDSGIPFVSAEAVSCGNGRIDFSHIRGYISEEFYEECCKKYIPQRDDIYMIKSGATTGRVAIVDTDERFTIWSPLAAFRCDREKMLPMFLFYALQAPFFQKQVELGWSFGTQQNIGMRVLEQLKIPVPPIEEQTMIVRSLEDKINKIDKAAEEIATQIADLEEYSYGLVFEAVTGKVDLCN